MMTLTVHCEARNSLALDSGEDDNVYSFTEFLFGFNRLADGSFGVEAFVNGDGVGTSASSSIDRGSLFLPRHLTMQTDADCFCRDADDVSWHKGSVIEVGDVVVALMNRMCDDSRDNSLHHVDYVVATYTADGQPIDSRVLGRSGSAWTTQLEGRAHGSKGVTMTVTRRDLPVPAMIKEDVDLTFTVSSALYTIRPDGHIECTSQGAPHSETVARTTKPADKSEFTTFLQLFAQLQTDNIDDSAFSNVGGEGAYDIDRRYIKAFVAPAPDCDCAPANALWTAGKRIDEPGRHILFMTKSCDVPRHGWPYAEFVVVVCATDGSLIDMRTIARRGDFCDAAISGSRSPLSITVKQGTLPAPDVQTDGGNFCTVVTQTCTINADGHIALTTAGRPFDVPTDPSGRMMLE